MTLDAGCGRGLGLVLFVMGFMTAPAIVMNGFCMPLARKLVFFSFFDLLYFSVVIFTFGHFTGLAVAFDTFFYSIPFFQVT